MINLGVFRLSRVGPQVLGIRTDGAEVQLQLVEHHSSGACIF